jgi:ankyrin repeat protein
MFTRVCIGTRVGMVAEHSLSLSRGHIDCARLLVEHKEDVHAKNRYGGFVLLIAIKGRDFNLVELGEEEMLCALDST